MSNVLNLFIERLTSNFNAKPGSNIHALLTVAADHIQENEDLLDQMGNWRDIDQAEGKTLDRIGGNVQQVRGQAPDEVYRVLIKSKIKRNLSNGSINTLIDFLSFILQIEANEVDIRELWEVGRDATLHIDVPGEAINATGLTAKQFGTLINLVVAAGVKAEVLFEGSFGFSNDYTTSQTADPDGFADDAKTTGGTLGYAYDPSKDYELPF